MSTMVASPVASSEGGTLVSIGLPTRNGAKTLEVVIRSVLAQDYEPLELVVSDNASTDGTEELCRSLAAGDARITYHRHPANLGLLNNFNYALHAAKGTFFRWIGDDDWIAPNYVSRCMQEFAADARLILVTSQLRYIEADGRTYTNEYAGSRMRSDDPIARYEQVASWLAGGFLPVDPLYALSRRAALTAIPRRGVIREDEVFATNLALAGSWGHVPETLGVRHIGSHDYPKLARYLGVPAWQAQVPTAMECREMLRFLRAADIMPAQRRRAQIAVGKLFVGRQWRTLVRRIGNLSKLGMRAKPRPSSQVP